MGACEPRQIREEAALSSPSQVRGVPGPSRFARLAFGSAFRSLNASGFATRVSTAVGCVPRPHLSGAARHANPRAPFCLNRLVAALYRKYRPQDFAEVVGQEAVVRTLTNAIAGGRGAAGLPLRRPARHGQDVDGAHPRQGPQLRAGPDADAGRHLPRLPRDRRRHLARRDRDGRRLAARHRRHPRDPRPRRPAAGRGALQGLHPRRGAPAHRRRLERAPEADRGAAAAPRLRLLHDRPLEGAADRPLALPDVRLPAAAPAGARRRCCAGSPTPRGSTRPTRRSR